MILLAICEIYVLHFQIALHSTHSRTVWITWLWIACAQRPLGLSFEHSNTFQNKKKKKRENSTLSCILAPETTIHPLLDSDPSRPTFKAQIPQSETLTEGHNRTPLLFPLKLLSVVSEVMRSIHLCRYKKRFLFLNFSLLLNKYFGYQTKRLKTYSAFTSAIKNPLPLKTESSFHFFFTCSKPISMSLSLESQGFTWPL